MFTFIQEVSHNIVQIQSIQCKENELVQVFVSFGLLYSHTASNESPIVVISVIAKLCQEYKTLLDKFM